MPKPRFPTELKIEQRKRDARVRDGSAKGPGRKPLSFTEKQAVDIRRRRADGESWDRIARAYGCSHTGLRRNFDPEFHAITNERAKQRERAKSTGRPTGRPPGGGEPGRHKAHRRRTPHGIQAMVCQPPEAARRIAERDAYLAKIADQPRAITAEFCGDPLPGRSALDRKLGINGGRP